MRGYTLLVCLYGVFILSLRKSADIAGYRQYLIAVADYAAMLYHKGLLSGIVLCGGRTEPKLPDVSEAQSVADLMLTMLLDRRVRLCDIKFLLEDGERSLNTTQNIAFGTLTITQVPGLSRNIIVICDNVRHPKALLICGWNWLACLSSGVGLVWYRVKSFPRADTHRNSRWWMQAASLLLYILLPLRFIKELRAK